MNSWYFLGLMGFAGLLAGLFLASYSAPADDVGDCRAIEQGIERNKTFNGSVTCRPPGVFGVNLSGHVQNSTELKCVCRKTYLGRVQYFPITVAD